jgi:flagellar protein FliJ
MTLSIDGHFGDVSRISVSQFSGQTGFKCKQTGVTECDPWTIQMEGQVADPKRRIPILKRLVADCDRLAADLDQEVRNEEDRVKIHDPAHSAYSTYARATTLRRDNLRRSADELRTHLAKAQKVGRVTLIDIRGPVCAAPHASMTTPGHGMLT